MKLIIDIPEEKYEWAKRRRTSAYTNSIVGAIANGTPYEEKKTCDEREACNCPFYTANPQLCQKCAWHTGGRR